MIFVKAFTQDGKSVSASAVLLLFTRFFVSLLRNASRTQECLNWRRAVDYPLVLFGIWFVVWRLLGWPISWLDGWSFSFHKTAMKKVILSWNISSYRPVIMYRRFGGTYCTLYSEDVGRNFLRASLKVYHTSRHHNPENNDLRTENVVCLHREGANTKDVCAGC